MMLSTDRPARQSDPLLQTFRIKHLTLKNRIVSTSHAIGLTDDEMPKERYQLYHEEKAIGGIALSMFGGSSNVGPDSPNFFNQINVGTDEVIPHFRSFADRMHRHGAALMCQLTHLGRRGTPYIGDWLPTIAPSAKRETLHRSIPREMNEHDMKRVVKYFGDAARRCKDGGLDGLETLSGGHLIGQFFSPRTNTRNDKYGGSAVNRARFALMVHEEIRRQVGNDFVVGIRYAVEDGTTFDDSIELARILQQSGLFDFFNVVFGRMDTPSALMTYQMPTMSMPSAPWLQQAARFKQAVNLPVIHSAKIADLATARHAVGEGLIDLVGMTRAYMADPHIAKRLMAGQEEQVRPCVGASYCRTYKTCIHNPSTGRESILPHEVQPAPEPRKTLVVGGGIAGLEAARVLALRGHRVMLFEAGSRLGGQVLLATQATWRKDLLSMVDWRIAELERLAVEVRLNTYVEASDVLALQPDVTIVATGGIPFLDDLPGAQHCLSTFDALTDQPPRTGRVLVYDGTGRHNAYICAERYAMAGLEVTLAVLDNQIGLELGGRGDEIVWRRRLLELGVQVRNDLELVRVDREGGSRRAFFEHQLTNEELSIDAEIVVVERGTEPVCEVFDELAPLSVNDGELDLERFRSGRRQEWPLAPQGHRLELYRIGDALSSRDVHSAVYDAFRLCRVL